MRVADDTYLALGRRHHLGAARGSGGEARRQGRLESDGGGDG